MKDKAYRSILKTISWRAVGTIDTIIISYVVIGDISSALSIGSIELFTKMTLYYLHERAWEKTSLGRKKTDVVDYQI